MLTKELWDIRELSRLLCVQSIKERGKTPFNFKGICVNEMIQ